MNILPPELSPTILLLFYVPFLALQVRRLHDTDRSGWYILLKIIPIIGVIILIILYSSKGDMDKNRFGPSPYKKPDNSFIWTIIGFIFIIFFIVLFIAINGSDFLAEKYNNKGITLLKEGKKEVALEAFDKALTYASEDEGLYLNKALALYELERYNDAILACQLAIEINPSFTQAYLIMGHSFVRLKSYKESLDSYNMVLKYEPNNKDALYRKASILMNLERLEEAKETYNKYMLYKDQS
jgi:tetratricopeptide (TPR) repeat protein